MAQRELKKRLGRFIGIKRRFLYKDTLSPRYTQAGFIKDSSGRELCSRTTLSRFESGKNIDDIFLLDFFLRKIDPKCRIMESHHEIIEQHASDLLAHLEKDSAYTVKDLTDLLASDDPLVRCDTFILILIERWLKSKICLSKEEFCYCLDFWKCIQSSLQSGILYVMLYSLYLNPECWTCYRLLIHCLSEQQRSNPYVQLLGSEFEYNHPRGFGIYMAMKDSASGHLSIMLDAFLSVWNSHPDTIVHTPYAHLLKGLQEGFVGTLNQFEDELLFLKQKEILSAGDWIVLTRLLQPEPYPYRIKQHFFNACLKRSPTKRELRKMRSLMHITEQN